MMDAGGGTVTAATYEYGNTFMIVAGLLNFLWCSTPSTSRWAASERVTSC